MNINRHNYETYFLLYVDNELSAAERKMVETFVRVNTDLEPELRFLQESTLPVEPVAFKSIDQLYKKTVELDALQEDLLLYMDNELDTVHKRELETRIKADQAVQKELQIWEQTRLDEKDQVVFKDKHLLYRHEGSRIVQFRIWKYAAAAAVLLFGMYTGYLALRKETPSKTETANHSERPAGKTETLSDPEKEKKNDAFKDSNKLPGENLASNNDLQTEKVQGREPVTVKHNDKQATNYSVAGNPSKKENAIIANSDFKNINKQESNESQQLTVLNKDRIERQSPEKLTGKNEGELANNKLSSPERPVTDINILPPMPDANARTAVFNENGSGTEDRIFYMKEENINRSRIGGVFRKMKRMIERNTNIRTGNGVRIAGFEIAAK